jgi:uncharacterized protein
MEYKRGGELIVAIIVFFVLLFAYTKLVGPIPFAVNSTNTATTDVFQSTGVGKASAAPDQAVINLGITTQGTTVEQAQTQANQASNKIIEALKEQGINEDDIKTTNYSINPNYSFTGENQRITGYSVSQNFEVEAPIGKTNQVVDSATAAGANNVGGITFKLNDKRQEELKNEARKEAVEKAKASAEGLAKAAGVKLGKIINVTESSAGTPVPMPFGAATKSIDQANAEDVLIEAPERVSSITPGESNVEVIVTLTYQTN